MSSLLLLALSQDARKVDRIGPRIGASCGVCFWLLAPILADLFIPQLSTGDVTAYATTLLLAGAITLIPGRIAELRTQGRIPGTGYPQKLRKRMWLLEAFLIPGAAGAMLIWGIGSPDNHDVWRGIVWGVAAISASEMSTLGAAKSVAIADEPA